MKLEVVSTATMAALLIACGGKPAEESGSGNRVKMAHVVSIGSRLGVSAPAEKATFLQLGDGSFLVAPLYSPGVVGVFNTHGELQTTIGRKGQGPTEFSSPRYAISDDAGRIHILDPGNSRISVWRGLDSLEKTIPLRDVVIRMWPSGPKEYIIHRLVPSGDTDASALALMNDRGVATLEFGPIGHEFQNSFSSTVASDGSVWMLPYNEYALLHYGPDGRQLETIRSNRFEKFSRLKAAKRALTPGATITVGYAIGALPTGHIVVVVGHIRRDKSLFPKATASHAPTATVGARSKMVDFTIDVWDPASRRLIANTEENEKYFLGFTNYGDLVEAKELENGTIVYDLWRLTIHTKEE